MAAVNSLYGVVNQKLTPDYLAQQLPLFQQRVPKSSQTSFQFPTNSPPNLPCPPLYPGEVVHLQQHRIVCTDVFCEPAVGAIYITNYRLIFYGNLISDPESLDALQEAHYSGKKESVLQSEGGGGKASKVVSKLTRSKNEPSFNSYLTNPDQDSPEQQSSSLPQPQKWFHSGLKKLGSLRRSPKRSAGGGGGGPAAVPPIGISPPSPPSSSSQGPPGARNISIGVSDPLMEESGEDVIDGPLDISSHNNTASSRRKKRKDIILSYCQDTVSLDSVSVSSISEFSEAPTTGTDERSIASPVLSGGELFTPSEARTSGHSSPSMFQHAALQLSVDYSLTSCPNSYQTDDSGINLLESPGNSVLTSTMHCRKESLPTGDGTKTKDRDEGSAFLASNCKKPLHNGMADGSKAEINGRHESEGVGCKGKTQETLEALLPDTIKCRNGDTLSTTSDTQPQMTGYSQVEILPLAKAEVTTCSRLDKDGTPVLFPSTSETRPAGYSAVDILEPKARECRAEPTPCTGASIGTGETGAKDVGGDDDSRRDTLVNEHKLHTDASNSSVVKQHHYTNLAIRETNSAPASPQISHSKVTRHQSQSSSLRARKPMPLPRKKLGSGAMDSHLPQGREEIFQTSLPANLHPLVVVPRCHSKTLTQETANEVLEEVDELVKFTTAHSDSDTTEGSPSHSDPHPPALTQTAQPSVTTAANSDVQHSIPSHVQSSSMRDDDAGCNRVPSLPPELPLQHEELQQPHNTSTEDDDVVDGKPRAQADVARAKSNRPPPSSSSSSSSSSPSSSNESSTTSVTGRPVAVKPEEDESRPTPPPRLKRKSKTMPSRKYVPVSQKKSPMTSLSESSDVSPHSTTSRGPMRHTKSLDDKWSNSSNTSKDQEGKLLTLRETSATTCQNASNAKVESEPLAKFSIGELTVSDTMTITDESDILNSTSTLIDVANSNLASKREGRDSTDELFSMSQESSDSSFKYLHQIVAEHAKQHPPPPTATQASQHHDRSQTHSLTSSPSHCTKEELETWDGGEGQRTAEDDTSSVSMAVNTSSSGSASLQRPHSMMSAYDATSNFVFQDGEERLSGGAFTMPRNGVVTWSPRPRTKGQQRARSPLPASTRYTLVVAFPLPSIHSLRKLQPSVLKEQGIKLPEGLLVLCRYFHSMKLHVHPHNTYDADGIKELMERKFLADKPLHRSFAFEYRAAIRHPNPTFLHNRSLPNFFQLTEEMKRLGLHNSKLWTVTRVLLEHADLCPSYPPRVVVPRHTPDTDLMRAAMVYREGRFPVLSWVDRTTGAALLQAASTKDDRGQLGVSRQVDEALLHAICGCNKSAKGKVQLYIFTEKTLFTDPKGSSLTADQVRTYYYHNCSFVHAMDPPSFKSVRHSFNKLQAMLESKLDEEDYLIALDTTKWLPRINELLSTACFVCQSLKAKTANVLVCYESGWDRTTQIVSLAQLLLDPYYRTMDGFQVLIQKEWVWFGHRFRDRHSRRGKVKEDSAIFLQWVDCVWQVMAQCPSAFQFNEKFLRTLVEHSYSGMFGSFVTNSEQERKQCFQEKGYEHMCVSTHTISFWMWVNMVNSAGRTFFNELYDPSCYPGVLYPNCGVPCMKLWSSHYCKYKPQENSGHPDVLRYQLEELFRLHKKLSTFAQSLDPTFSPTSTTGGDVSPTDDLSPEWPTDEGGAPVIPPSVLAKKPRPVPPPKPLSAGSSLTSSTSSSGSQVSTIEQLLTKEGLDPSVCKHITFGPSTCQGYLYKLGAVRKNWLKRWFVLDFSCQYMAYFQDQAAYANREAPKGVINLSDIKNVFQSINRREHLIKNIFSVETPSRTYLMQAPTIITMELWMASLKLPSSSVWP